MAAGISECGKLPLLPEKYADTVRLVYLKGSFFWDRTERGSALYGTNCLYHDTGTGTRFNIEAHEEKELQG